MKGKVFEAGVEWARNPDIIIADKDSFDIIYVIAKGKEMISDGKVIVKGTFEK